jgi:hypothetical protein
MSIRLFIKYILLFVSIHSSPIFAGMYKNLPLIEGKEDIKDVYKEALKIARTYLKLSNSDREKKRSNLELEEKIMNVLDNAIDNLNHQSKTYSTNHTRWIGQAGLDIRHPKGELINPRNLGKLSKEGKVYYTGSVEALEYSTSLFLIKSIEAVTKIFYEHFDLGHVDKTDQQILYPKSGIAEAQNSLREKTDNA